MLIKNHTMLYIVTSSYVKVITLILHLALIGFVRMVYIKC